MKIPTSADDESTQHATTYNKLWRREMKALLFVSAIALVPLWFLVRGRQASQPAIPAMPARTISVNPNSPWRLGNNRWRNAHIKLSPSGQFLAAICPMATPGPTPGSTPLPSTVIEQSSDLVIWRLLDGAEMARIPLGMGAPESIQWSRNEALVAAGGQVYTWKSGMPVNMPRTMATSSMNSVTATWLDVDGDLEIRADMGKNLEAWQISTGNSLTLAPQIGHKINDGGYVDGSAAFALQPTTPGGPIRVAVLREEPRPVITPQPTPTPIPTPTPSAEQSAFLKEEARLDEEVSQLMNTLQGEEPLSDEEIARMEARVKAINAQLKTERARLFAAPAPAPTPTPMPPRWARLTLWDLKSGQPLWQERLRSGFSTAVLSWSPDAKILAVVGTPRPAKRIRSMGEEQRGLEFFQGETGTKLGSGALDAVFGWLSTKDVAWLPGSRLAVKDRDNKGRPFLRFFNAANGQAVQSWSLAPVHEAFGNSFEAMTTDSTGSQWVFATGQQGWRVFSQSELDAAAQPMPTTATNTSPRREFGR